MDAPAEDFGAYVARSSVALAGTAYLLTGDRGLAEDLVQDALAAVASRWATVVKAGDPDAYVRRTMVNRSIDQWRRKRARPAEVLGDDRAAQAVQHADPDLVERRVVLRDALMRLTPRQRAVLVTRFYDDHTEQETARLLDCSVNTVKSQTRLALRRLREGAPELADLVGAAARAGEETS